MGDSQRTECSREEGKSVGPAAVELDSSGVDGWGLDGQDVEGRGDNR